MKTIAEIGDADRAIKAIARFILNAEVILSLLSTRGFCQSVQIPHKFKRA